MVICFCQGSDGRDLKISGHVGFDSLPDQMVNKCVNKGFDFNILCIGKKTVAPSINEKGEKYVNYIHR